MHKIAFEFGNFTIYWYGILVALGFLAGLWTASRRALIANVAPERIVDLGPWLIVGTIVGARTLYVIFYWREEFVGESLWQMFNIRRGGLIYYGGLVGASLACVYYVRRKNLALWTMADILAPSIALGHAFGRVGCLMNGCCYGTVCDLPWAIQFPSDHPTHANAVHPTQLYEALLNLLLYLGLAWMFRRRQFEGQIFAAYLLCYAVVRAFVEMFRGDYTTLYFGIQATPAQVISIGIFAAGVALWQTLPKTGLSSRPPASS